MSNLNATNLGQPPECDPLYEQACDEVGKAFDAIPASVMDALDCVDPCWLSQAQDHWVAIRVQDLRDFENERRISSEEP